MVVATYFYYENVRRTMRTAIVSNLRKVSEYPLKMKILKAIFCWFNYNERKMDFWTKSLFLIDI